MRSMAGVALVVFSGCRAIFGLEAPARQSDAAVVDSVPDVARRDAQVSCMDKWLAGTPELSPPELFVEVNSAATDAAPAASDLVVTWGSDRGGTGTIGGVDIWYIYRPAIGQPWSAPTPVPNVNSVDTDWRLTTMADTLTGFLGSNRPGGEGAADIWTTRRMGAAMEFLTPTQLGLAAVNDTGEQTDPAISADGLELFLSTSGTIAAATRLTTNDAFAPPIALGELDVSGDRDPAPASDPRLLLFTSNRLAVGGPGDIFYALRPGRGQPFSTPAEVPIVNSPSIDADPWLTPDGCTLYFTSTRQGSAGADIYVARMLLN